MQIPLVMKGLLKVTGIYQKSLQDVQITRLEAACASNTVFSEGLIRL